MPTRVRLTRKDVAMLTIAREAGTRIIREGGKAWALVPVQSAVVQRLVDWGCLTYAAEDERCVVLSEAGRAALLAAERGDEGVRA